MPGGEEKMCGDFVRQMEKVCVCGCLGCCRLVDVAGSDQHLVGNGVISLLFHSFVVSVSLTTVRLTLALTLTKFVLYPR